MNETIIITGIKGFVGSNLKSYLQEAYSIKGLSRVSDPDIFVYGFNDIDNLLKKSKAFIHLAGKAHDLKNVTHPDEYYQVNFKLTKQLFDAFLKSNAEKFIFISTVKAAADSLNETLTEEHTPNPQTHYGKSKLMAEEYIQSQILPPGKSYYILRPCMIHGSGNKGNLNLLYNFVSKGFPYPLASFKNKRSYLSVDNLCFIISELLKQKDIPSGIYNVSDDEALSTTEVVSLLSDAQNKTPRLLHVPEKLILFLTKIGNILKLPLNSETLGKLTENYEVSNQKIKKILKKELPLSAREGIVKTAKIFKNPIV